MGFRWDTKMLIQDINYAIVRTQKFLIKEKRYMSKLSKYGDMGVAALEQSTPKKTGLTANSWYYTIDTEQLGVTRLTFRNRNIQHGQNIAILLLYGHATKNGGYVEGIDYVTPALRPVFLRMAKDAWEATQDE